MSTVTSPESRPVAKRKKPEQPEPVQEGASFDRFEMQVPPGWLQRVDRVAKSLGLSRSAYIRQATNLKLATDEAALGEGS